MTVVTMEEMSSKLLTVEDTLGRLEATEPLEAVPIKTESKVHFTLGDSFTEDLATFGPNDSIDAAIEIDGTEYILTRDAALQAASNVGLPGAYVKRTPGDLIQSHLNYHYSHGMDGKSVNALVVKDNLSAFTSEKIRPFSNIDLFEEARSAMYDTYGSDTEMKVDYKFTNSLLSTDIRLIATSEPHVIQGGGMPDVPDGGQDTWYPGITLHNSLAGRSMTSLDSYLFRFWCTNGAITTFDGVGTWNRRLNQQNEEEVMEWTHSTASEILAGMEAQFTRVQALTTLNLGSATAEVLKGIFAEWDIPVSQRDAIREMLLGAETLTMYTLMQAITRVANDSDLTSTRQDRLMRIGGALPTRQYDNLKAKIWREGHEASEDTNPYELVLGQ